MGKDSWEGACSFPIHLIHDVDERLQLSSLPMLYVLYLPHHTSSLLWTIVEIKTDACKDTWRLVPHVLVETQKALVPNTPQTPVIMLHDSIITSSWARRSVFSVAP